MARRVLSPVDSEREAEFDVSAVDDLPVEPGEPVVSADAVGTDPMAAPTPNANARAPIRPTWRAYPDAAGRVATLTKDP